MFAIVNNKQDIVGQTSVAVLGDEYEYVPISDELYQEMMANPRLYSLYKVSREDGKPSVLVYTPKITKGANRLVRVLETEAPDIEITISSTSVRVKASRKTPLGEPVELTGFYKSRADSPVLHALLKDNESVKHSVKDFKNIHLFVTRPYLEYIYGIVYVNEDQAS